MTATVLTYADPHGPEFDPTAEVVRFSRLVPDAVLGDVDRATQWVDDLAAANTPAGFSLAHYTVSMWETINGTMVAIKAMVTPLPMPLLWEGDQA